MLWICQPSAIQAPSITLLNYNESMNRSQLDTALSESKERIPTSSYEPTSKIKRAFCWSFVVVGLITAIFILTNRSRRMIDVDRNILSQARDAWNTAALENYLVEVAVTTTGTDIYEVTVVDNEPVQVKLNGRSLHRRHAFDTWTIAGMLDVIAIDIEHCERWDEGRAAPGTCDLIIKATFDPQQGIPVKYIRMELGRPSNVGVMDWEITRFERKR
ncbi:MAG: hypothetical protein VX776_09440 [Planctomycetota bacterium]|nr:hypothetical protein [Planctomycetota bacterium]